jgi:predicted GH43/DUF377 family glycosyl hydrolase
LERIIRVQNKSEKLDLVNIVHRYDLNPILTCHDINKVWKKPELQVVTVHNAGITNFQGKTLMLFRSHLRNGISILGIARSENGLTDWEVDPSPALVPCTKADYFATNANVETLVSNEGGGIEDARITRIDNEYLITYSAYHTYDQHRVRVSLAITKDFNTYYRYGPVLESDMRNVVIFPERIRDHYYGLFRPNDSTTDHTGGIFKQILLGKTANYHKNDWKIEPTPIMRQSGIPSFFSDKIGPGAPPIKTKYGWLNIFHGVRSSMDGNPYYLGVAFHDMNDPSIMTVSNFPILFPSKADCRVENEDYIHVPNVVFTCGAERRSNGEIYIYYGGNDTVMNLGISHEDILFELCRQYPQDPNTGRALHRYY